MKRLSVMHEGELLATLAAALPFNNDLGYLTGPRHVKARVSVMQVALRRKVTQKEAGINALRETLQVALGIQGNGSIAAVERGIAQMVSEHRSDEKKKATMSVDDIMRAWRTM